MSERDALLDRLATGAGAADAALRDAMSTGEDDRALAAALVKEIAAEPPRLAQAEPEPAKRASLTPPPDASFLSRLGAGGRDLAEIDDVDTLFGVLEGGSLAQRRAAALRIEQRIESGDLAPEELERVETALAARRDPDIAWEVLRARAALPGAAGREVRHERDAFASWVGQLTDRVRAFGE